MAKFEQMNIFEMKAGAEEISMKHSGSQEAKFIFVAEKTHWRDNQAEGTVFYVHRCRDCADFG
jgi:hypothetical protein